jgi:hypothetical protein
MPRKHPFSRIAPKLDPAFAGLGFIRLDPRESRFTRTWPTWRRPHRDSDCIICDIQPWKWGYDPLLGSSFTLNFTRLPIDFETTFDQRRRLHARILDLTDEGDRRRIAAIQDAVIAKTRATEAEESRRVKDLPRTTTAIREGLRRHTSLERNDLARNDVWLAFTDEADTAIWWAFLSEWLPKGVSRFASSDDLTGHVLRAQLIARWAVA